MKPKGRHKSRANGSNVFGRKSFAIQTPKSSTKPTLDFDRSASILVLRGQDGVVRGFHNVCSHRGNTLAWDEKGKCRGYLTCNFHNWGYDSKGELKWVPDKANFFNLDKSQLGLTPVTTEVFNRFIFINLDPKPRENLVQYLDGLDRQLAGADTAFHITSLRPGLCFSTHSRA